MRTLAQLIADHGRILILDASSANVQVGWLVPDESPRWTASGAEAGNAVFRGIAELAVDVQTAGAFVYCDGPGSILGVRTTAMAIRIWNVLAARPVFAYHSLTVLAHAVGDAATTFIADARRDSWHALRLGDPLRRVCTPELPADVTMPDGFRTWSRLERQPRTVPYDLARIWPRIADVPVLRPTTAPDAFLHEEPAYAKWTPQIHRAP